MIKKGIALILLAVMLIMTPSIDTDAKTTNRYATQTIRLRSKAGGKVMLKIKRNTKVVLIKQGKKWSRVRYQGDNYSALTKYLNSEKLPSKKKSRYYIKYLHTKGPVYWHNRKYTYYTSRALPIWKLPVKGLHIDKNGMWCDKNDYIVLGSSRVNQANKLIVVTPFGKYGRVYDTGGWSTPSTLCDVAVTW